MQVMPYFSECRQKDNFRYYTNEYIHFNFQPCRKSVSKTMVMWLLLPRIGQCENWSQISLKETVNNSIDSLQVSKDRNSDPHMNLWEECKVN